jgi:hypothetical protein
MFCTIILIFDGTESVGSRFHVLWARTRFRRCRGRRIPFSYFARPNYQRRRVPFSCLALPDSFSAVRRTSAPVFMFCATGLVFGGSEGIGSHFHVLCASNHFRWYRRRRVPFLCFALLDSFSMVPRLAGLVFMFCVSGLIFGVTKGVRSRFFFCGPGLVFGGVVGVRSRFHVLRNRTRFRRYRGRRVSFSCFAVHNSFCVEMSVSGPVFMFRAHRLIFDGTVGVGSRFHVLRRTHFRRYRGHRLPGMFSEVRWVWGSVFMF